MSNNFSDLHTARDDNGFGRHINLHLTYSFQQQANAKQLYPPPVSESSLDDLSQESTMHCMQGEV